MPRPNVLWIMTDQHHADALGHRGGQVRTPHLDGLAAAGVGFTGAYCNNPICAPSRASYLTGQYLHTHGLQGNDIRSYPGPCPTNLATAFRQRGWRTGLLGKAHLPARWVNEGFEHVRFTDLCDADRGDPTTCHYFQHLAEHGLAGSYEDGTPRPGHRGDLDGSAPARLPYEFSNERYTGDQTLAFLEAGEGDDRPFFCQMSFERPHSPICPAPEYFDLYDPDRIELPPSAVDWFERRLAGKPQWMQDALRGGLMYPLAQEDPATLRRCLASYYALITCIDQEIGRAFQWLREHGQWENTIVVFCADHGDFGGDHGLFHKNFGIPESIHRIPFILRWPGGPAGVTRSGLVESIDLHPTLCELCGVPLPEGVEGESLLPVARGESVGKAEALCEWSWLHPVYRINALRTPTHRLVYYSHELGGELYDTVADPGEIDNRWDDATGRELRLELLERLFDRVNQYRAPSEMRDDRVTGLATRWSPTTLVHFGKHDWDELREYYATVVPAR